MARLTELDKIATRLTDLDKMRSRSREQIAGWDAEAQRLMKRRTWLLDDPDLQPEPERVTVPGTGPLPERTAEAGDTGPLPPLPDDAYPEGATPLEPARSAILEPKHPGDTEPDPAPFTADEIDPLSGDPWEYPGPEGEKVAAEPAAKPAKGK